MSARGRWTAFGLWTAVVFAATPYANDIQGWIRDQLGEGGLRLALSVLLVAVTAGIAARLFRRGGLAPAAVGARLAWLLALAAAAFTLMWRLSVAAEPAHLALYGILGWLAFRALSVHLSDAGVYPAAAALTAIAGTVDEILQWLLPSRFWDLSDVGLNVAAGVMVQLVIWRVVRPAGIASGFSVRSLRIAARLAIAEALLLLLCLSNTPRRIEWYAARVPGLGYLGQGQSTWMSDYGHLHTDPEIGRFRSRLAADELRAFDRQHGAEVAKILGRLRDAGYGELQRQHSPAHEPFVYEALGHLFWRQNYIVRARKQKDPKAQAELATAAYRENMILERYFPSSVELSGHALKPRPRRWLESRQRPGDAFESRSSEWLITAFSETQARGFLLVALAALIVAERACTRRLEIAGGDAAGE